MKLSRKSDYALRAMLHLAGDVTQGPVPVREIAARNNIPRKFLEAIMRDLRELGLVESVAGKKGGYMLAKAPAAITVGAILRHFDGHLDVIEGRPGDGEESVETEERVQRLVRGLGLELDRLIDETSLEALLRGQSVAPGTGRHEEYSLGTGI